jgi:FdhD protein
MTDEHTPSLTQRNVNRNGVSINDWLVVEEPLEMRVDGRSVAVVLRTPGASSEEDLDLVVGFLLTEGVIDDIDDLTGLGHCTDPARPNRGNVVITHLASGTLEARRRLENAQREMYVGSSCGVCGKATIDKVFQRTEPIEVPVTLDANQIAEYPLRLRERQPRFDQTGGLHGAAILNGQGHIVAVAEDIGRHNAVDKVIGHCLRNGLFPLHGHVLVVSSRAGFEIVQKAIMARIGALVSVGAASSLADELARRSGLNLYSFVRGTQFNHHVLTPPVEAVEP